MRAVSALQNRAVSLNKNYFSENFRPVCDSLISVDIDIKNADENEPTFSWRKAYKSGRKTETV